MDFSLGRNPTISFHVETSAGGFWPWMWITEDMRFDFMKAQLELLAGDRTEGAIFVSWDDSTMMADRTHVFIRYL